MDHESRGSTSQVVRAMDTYVMGILKDPFFLTGTPISHDFTASLDPQGQRPKAYLAKKRRSAMVSSSSSTSESPILG